MSDTSDKIKVALVCEGSGHYTQMKFLEEAFRDFDYFYITTANFITRENPNAYLLKSISLSSKIAWLGVPFHFAKVFIKSLLILRRERPAVMVSTGGSEVVVPALYAGKVLGIKLIHIEPLTRVETCSLAGKCLRPIVDKVFVRHPELVNKYGRKAEFCGSE